MAAKSVAVSVGVSGADVNGSDNRALQAAVDYVAALGGGSVHVGPGTYLMRDSLHLRANVQVQGSGRDTVLRKDDARISPLLVDADYGENLVVVAEPEYFEPGRGILIESPTSPRDLYTVATVVSREGNALTVDVPMYYVFLAKQGARAATAFPVVSAYNVKNAALENLTLDGNKDNNPWLDGCRGGCLFAYKAHNSVFRDILARDYHGDGISWQTSNDVLVERCEVTGCTHLGIHPGTGAQRPVVRDCYAHHNGQIGLYLCWCTQHGLYERNRLEGNGETGISIGHRDTDNLFRDCIAVGNRRQGVHFRDVEESTPGDRNTFEDCRMVDNGEDGSGYGIRVDGEATDLVFRRCLVGNSGAGTAQGCGLYLGERAGAVTLEDVEFRGNQVVAVEDRRIASGTAGPQSAV
jgi:hypothetical protein